MKIEISNFIEEEYDLYPFDIDGYLIIEKDKTFIRIDNIEDYLLFYIDSNIYFKNEEGNILQLSIEQEDIINSILIDKISNENEEENGIYEMSELQRELII